MWVFGAMLEVSKLHLGIVSINFVKYSAGIEVITALPVVVISDFRICVVKARPVSLPCLVQRCKGFNVLTRVVVVGVHVPRARRKPRPRFFQLLLDFPAWSPLSSNKLVSFHVYVVINDDDFWLCWFSYIRVWQPLLAASLSWTRCLATGKYLLPMNLVVYHVRKFIRRKNKSILSNHRKTMMLGWKVLDHDLMEYQEYQEFYCENFWSICGECSENVDWRGQFFVKRKQVYLPLPTLHHTSYIKEKNASENFREGAPSTPLLATPLKYHQECLPVEGKWICWTVCGFFSCVLRSFLRFSSLYRNH